jgi:acyl-CoA thioesterase FadM
LEDHYSIDISVSKIGRTSFELEYLFLKDSSEVAKIKTVHVVAEKKSGRPTKLPEKLLDGLKKYQT